MGSELVELLESEYVDHLMSSLCSPYSIMQIMGHISKSEVRTTGEDGYLAFSDYYSRLINNPLYAKVKGKLKVVDERREEHSPNFELLKLFLHQIDVSVEAINPFFKVEDNNSDNFRERFRPFSAYLKVMVDAIEGIKGLNRIYGNIVDTDKIAERLREKGEYHS